MWFGAASSAPIKARTTARHPVGVDGSGAIIAHATTGLTLIDAIDGDLVSVTAVTNVRNEGEQQIFVNDWFMKRGWLETELGAIKTEKLLRRGERRGINLYADQSWWTETERQYSHTRFLTDTGLSQANRLLRDDFLKSVKDWVHIYYQVTMMLIGLGGIIIAVLNSK